MESKIGELSDVLWLHKAKYNVAI